MLEIFVAILERGIEPLPLSSLTSDATLKSFLNLFLPLIIYLVLFRYFNVKAREGDLFSRCVLCNGDEYLKVPGNLLLKILVRNFKGFPATILVNL